MLCFSLVLVLVLDLSTYCVYYIVFIILRKIQLEIHIFPESTLLRGFFFSNTFGFHNNNNMSSF